MKTCSFICYLIVFALVSCQSTPKIETKTIQENDQTQLWNITIHRTEFITSQLTLEPACIFFNDEIKGLTRGIQAAFQEQAQTQKIEMDSLGHPFVAPFELYIRDSVFQADENFFSILVSAYQMLGGANGVTHFYGINYQVKTKHFLSPKEILNFDKKQEINALLKTYLKDPEKCYTFADPTIDNLTALNLTPSSVEFTYAKYILGPGACGPLTISIPLNKMQDMFHDAFLQK